VQPLLNIAVRAARRAGEVIIRSLNRLESLTVTSKGRNDFVTEVDQAAEQEIIATIRRHYPQLAFLAEESGQSGDHDTVWIIDPLDGTTNYAHGLPIYGVSIALEAAGRVVLGVVNDPSQRELFVAERGRGAYCNDVRLAVSSTDTLDASLLATGFPYDIRVNPDNNLKEYAAFSVRSRGVRRLGSAVLYLSWVAAGRFDGYWELRLGAWDVAAAGLMVEEAGGRLTAIDGGPLDLDTPTVVASNGRIHDQILNVLREIRRP
jgi:myo-inositol-1(or 4)-monophosphatase